MTVGSLFSGIGGIDEAFRRAGASIKWSGEIDPACCSILRRHFPGVPHIGDVKAFADLVQQLLTESKFDELKQLGVSILAGGSPCQDLSCAGNRAGLAGKRSGLFYDMARVAWALRPRFILWENVVGALSSNDGRDFAQVIGHFTGLVPTVPADGWGNAGCFKALPGLWNVCYRVFDAQYFGVPQRRRRIVLVGSLGNGSCAEVLFEQGSLRGHSEASGAEGEDVAAEFGESAEGSGNEWGGYKTAPALMGSGRGSARVGETRGQDCVIACNHAGRTIYNATDYKTGEFEQAEQLAPLTTTTDRSRNGLVVDSPIAFDPNQITSPDNRSNPEPDLCYTMTPTTPPAGSMGRRLTPVECCRLQGLPDDWNEWGIDAQGARVPMSDTTRYKQTGNGVALPVFEWVARRILDHAGK